MSILGPLTPTEFLRDTWQRAPRLFSNVWSPPDAEVFITAEDLAGLACESEVESRLILNSADSAWVCEHGPFDEQRFQTLPKRNWTLLVQAVEQWIPDVAALLDLFDFLPRWRLDDIMFSHSAEGGGVGPHYDLYDVFLIQAMGSRTWRIGQHCEASEPVNDAGGLKLLQHFEELDRHRLHAGDMLYVPPGCAHWGVADSDDCMTISVGFRAPSHAELLLALMQSTADSIATTRRYTDSLASIDSDPFCINAAAIEQAALALENLDPLALRRTLGGVFGELVTEPRYPDEICLPDAAVDAPQAALKPGVACQLAWHPASRMAYSLSEPSHPVPVVATGLDWRVTSERVSPVPASITSSDDSSATLFVNGTAHATSARVARAICSGSVSALLMSDLTTFELLRTLVDAGAVGLR